MVLFCKAAPLVAAGHFALVGGHSRTPTVFSTQLQSRFDSGLESDDQQARGEGVGCAAPCEMLSAGGAPKLARWEVCSDCDFSGDDGDRGLSP